MVPLLKTEELSLRINGKEIFSDVNLSIKHNEIHALIGVNGSGKSSIANVLMGVQRPTYGKIIFEGRDITELSISERAKLGITLAWQEPARFEGITIRQYLQLSSSKVASEQEISDALLAVGLLPKKYLDRYVDEGLSGGERKRIELASIYLFKPKLAILDEADSGIDFFGLEQLLETIRSIAQHGSILLITHQDKFLQIADRATLICHGKILKTGEANEISKYFRYQCSTCEDEEPKMHIGDVILGEN